MQQQSRPPQLSPARIVAFEVLEAVETDDAYANLLLPVRIGRAALSDVDARLATELTYGTLRMRGFYDRVIEIAANRPTSKIDPRVLDALRLGAHQLLSTRIPTHAAVNESVELVRRYATRSAIGFANGVLRAISRRSTDEWREDVSAEARSDDERLAELSSHPEWVIRAFRGALERDGLGDTLDELLEADNVAPVVNLIALPGVGLGEPDDYGTPNRYSPLGFTRDGEGALELDVHGGRIRVQDEGSQLAALALSRARPVVAGERWLDLCAGPGGKAVLLAAEALASGAVLDANEVIPVRADLVRSALSAVSTGIPVSVVDGRAIGEERPGYYDRILLDAPCTGLGALRRRPEARWRKSPRDVAELTRLQGELLDSAVAALRPGGILAYVTCSPHTAETHGVVKGALSRWGDTLTSLDVPTVLDGLTRHPLDLPAGPHAQLWPHRDGTDAMFIALLEKH
ncbi:rRNA small subunit methyltransferase B [Agromyces atrinae]|uniref:RsmB/NOP family class I SAM-dependent RNA methyltransferase n=1 Tax=Agromyces atrinae TaxID=592376 RepID=UPI001F55FDB1|nr:transcription antitermination factor NusB [Agromyces atrinae]MCI2958513.1 rRNA small subunit methyltransferase B [Agromyces atrinae]